MALDDTIEFFSYFIGFWLFIFNKDYRNNWFLDFWKASFIGKVFQIIIALPSIAIGLGVPLLLIYLVVVE